MVRHTKSNARWRSSCRSVADGGEGTNSVGNGVASPICRPIMLYGSTIEQPAIKIGVRYEIKIRVRYAFRRNPEARRHVCCIWHALLDFSFPATPPMWSTGATTARRSSILRQITDFYGVA